METSLFSIALMLMILKSVTLTTPSAPFPDSTTDHDALLAFKAAITSDPHGLFNSSWSSNTSMCYWTGVSCSLQHRVTALNLSGLELLGTLAPHLGNLTFLQSLDISSNNFTGPIPSQLSHLQYLTAFFASANQFTTGLSIFTNMSSLKEIDMRFNQLSGELPFDLCSSIPELRSIRLSENQLSGRIPASMHECRKLEVLTLNVNNFSGSIPSEIGNLTMLTTLAVCLNFLEGKIPSSIFNISTLQYVDLSDNHLIGSIPAFNNLPCLERLYLFGNNFTGHIPNQIGNISLLNTLDISLNKLEGELPGELGNLVNIKTFQACFNDLLNGSIPASIFNLSTLVKLGLQQNQLSGTLPSTMGFSLFNLQELYLHSNRLSGGIPSSINNASKLTTLELHKNSFTGSVPDFGGLRELGILRIWGNNLTGLRFLASLTNCQDLKNLEISSNPMMKGILPPMVGNLSTSLLNFEAVGCSIGGVIPSEFGNLSSLRDLDLSMNKLQGFIPTTLGRLNQLGRLYLYDNRLRGNIPHELCKLSRLIYLQLHINMLTGSIPECLGGINSLSEVSLASNKLSSTLPTQFFNLSDLKTLDLSFNKLSGQIPDEIRQLRMIYSLNVSSNKLSGNIPNSFRSCTSLERLNLSNNMLSGSIPESFDELKVLSALDLSKNHLSGFIPKSLVKLKDLAWFNVSCNQLKGEIPDEGCFRNLSAQSFLDNLDLCGTTRFLVPPCNHPRPKRRKGVVTLLMMYIVPPFLAVVALVACILVLMRRRRPEKPQPAAADDLSLKVGWSVISERELRQGTDSFSEMNLLGKGCVGSVFKATVVYEGRETEVAVKVFDLQVEGAIKSFETESKILSSIRHRNLVKILGCCSNLEFKALILAYMPNGSLDRWLHSDKAKHFLDLEQRLKIAVDIASALEYLHHYHTFPVVHCDIKPNNVLLDQDMTAHVGDFGIAKLFHCEEATLVTKNMGTIGYAAPEVGEGKVSTSGDVYSYGILLLEMFTNRRPRDEMFGGEMSMKDWVEKALKEDAINEIVAPGLVSREDPHFTTKLGCVSCICELAMRCSTFSPHKRLHMKQVVVAIRKIKLPVEELSNKKPSR